MIQLQIAVGASECERIVARLCADDRIATVSHIEGAALKPAGDLIICDITREAVSDVLDWLAKEGIDQTGGLTLLNVDAAPSKLAKDAEAAAPGAPEDAVIWDEVLDRSEDSARTSWVFYTFFALAVLIACVAIVNDSAILVVGAMVVGPEFAAVAAIAVGIALRRPALAGRAAWLLLRGLLLSIAVAVVFTLILRGFGFLPQDALTKPRPLTAFIYEPNTWSVVVALLAGAAGVLSQTAGQLNALVGVFISVTTIPAIADFSMSIALGDLRQTGGSALQFGLNFGGMIVAGVLVLMILQGVTFVRRHREARLADASAAEPASRGIR